VTSPAARTAGQREARVVVPGHCPCGVVVAQLVAAGHDVTVGGRGGTASGGAAPPCRVPGYR